MIDELERILKNMVII